VNKVEFHLKLLAEKEERWVEMEKRMHAHAEVASNKILLDIGGQRFATAKTTLLAYKGTFFEAMLSSGQWKPDSDGAYFIDRNPELFPVILDYMRMGSINLSKYSYDVMDSLRAEFDFYAIVFPEPELKEFVESKLLTDDQKRKLLEWTGKSTAKLLYSATRDGFTATAFHNLCDKQGMTVTIVKSQAGWLFGGFATRSWDCSNTSLDAPGSFLFTLTNPLSFPPAKFVALDNCLAHIFCTPLHGPTFGGISGQTKFGVVIPTYDLIILNNSKPTCSTPNFPTTYKDTYGRGCAIFGDMFCIVEIEVFVVS